MTMPPTGDLSQFGEVAAVIIVLASGVFTLLTARTRSAPVRNRSLRVELRQTRRLYEMAMGYIHRLRAAYARDTGKQAPPLPRELAADGPDTHEDSDDRSNA